MARCAMGRNVMFRWLTMPNGLGLFIYLLILWLFSIVATNVLADSTTADTSEAIQGAIEELVASEPRHPLYKSQEARQALADAIAQASDEYDVPPFLMLTIAYRESSLRIKALGKIGEAGLFQLHGVARRSCPHELNSDPLTHARCGARWLRVAFEMCGKSWEYAILAYGSGSCRAGKESMWARRAVNRLKMAKRLEDKWHTTQTKK